LGPPNKAIYEKLGDGLWQNYFSKQSYFALNPDLSLSDATEEHFRTIGYKSLRRFNPGISFDPVFYRDLYPDLVHLPDEAAYKHWLIYGLGENRLASAQAYLGSVGYSGSLPRYFSSTLSNDKYAHRAADYRAFLSFLSSSAEEFQSMLASIDINFLDIGTIARYFVSRGAIDKAIFCLEIRAHKCPVDTEALGALADLKLQSGERYGALKLYEAVLAHDSEAVGPAVNAADILASFGDFERALTLLGNVLMVVPDMYHLRPIGMSYAKRLFAREHGMLVKMAAGRQVEEARELTRHILASSAQKAVSFSLGPVVTQAVSSKRVAIFAFTEPRQCFRYRVDHKLQQLAANGIEAQWFDANDPRRLRDQASRFGSVIFFRVPGAPEIYELIEYCNRLGIQTIYEVDDLIIDPDNYPPPLESMGGLVTKEEWGRFVLDPILLAGAARACSYGIGSTEKITNELAKLVRTGIAFTHRNGFLEADYAPVQAETRHAPHPGRITIFYGSGSRSHTGNFYNGAAQAIVAIMQRHPSVDLQIVGPLTLDKSFESFGARVKRAEPIAVFRDYLKVLARADINIAPLDGSAFADAKSEIKWMEAALVGVPSVVSRSSNYEDVVHEGVDGLLASNQAEWYDALNKLVRDASVRRAMAAAAQRTVTAKYNEETMGSALATRLAEFQPEQCKARTDKLKVAQVNVYFAPQTIGGATRIVETLAQELGRQGCLVEVFGSLAHAGYEGAHERYAALGCDVTLVAPSTRSQGAAEDDGLSRAAFVEFLDRFKPDVVHFHCIQNLTASLLDETRERGIPTIVTVHDGWWVSDNQFLVRPDGTLVEQGGVWGDPNRLLRLRQALASVDRIISVSDYFARLYRERIGVRVDVIANPVTQFHATDGPAVGPLAIGLLGGLGLAKGSDLLHQVLCHSTFPNLRFTLVDHAVIEGQIRRENWGENEVTIIGKIKQARIADLYGQLNVVLAPSICVESFGLVVREAISLGKWVVVSDRGALSECVKEGVNGFVIDVSNVLGLLNVLRKLDANPNRYRKHKATQLDLPTAEQVGGAYVALYREVAAQPLSRTEPEGGDA
jgi:glycosyltransferase involved in cell wall biosynthesis